MESWDDCPPGIVGDLARYIFDQAPRPVREIALAGALAFLSGIVGRQFNVSGTGLNTYIMLIAPTGTGKEAVNQGISKLASSIAPISPKIREHIGPGEIRSDAALLKQFARSKCFLTISGEVGLLIKRMSGPRANPNDLGIKRVLLDLYNKSGHGNMLNPMVYSDSTKSTEGIEAPAFSFFGESTPERFFEALDETMVSDGLLPRFIIIEYTGDRPSLNAKAQFAQPTDELIQRVASLSAKVNELELFDKVAHVAFHPWAERLFRDFDLYCDDQIRGSKEVYRQIWNRSHLKAMKLAALVAVGINWEAPVIGQKAAAWAINLIKSDAENLIGRFERGEVGDLSGNEIAQQDRVREVMRECLERPYDEISKTYGGTAEMHATGLITHQYLQRRLLTLPMFKHDPIKATPALKRAIESLANNSEIESMSRQICKQIFGHTFVCYRFAEYDSDNLVEEAKSRTFFKPDIGQLVRTDMKKGRVL